jgi:hypothetical protein
MRVAVVSDWLPRRFAAVIFPWRGEGDDGNECAALAESDGPPPKNFLGLEEGCAPTLAKFRSQDPKLHATSPSLVC